MFSKCTCYIFLLLFLSLFIKILVCHYAPPNLQFSIIKLIIISSYNHYGRCFNGLPRMIADKVQILHCLQKKREKNTVWIGISTLPLGEESSWNKSYCTCVSSQQAWHLKGKGGSWRWPLPLLLKTSTNCYIYIIFGPKYYVWFLFSWLLWPCSKNPILAPLATNENSILGPWEILCSVDFLMVQPSLSLICKLQCSNADGRTASSPLERSNTRASGSAQHPYNRKTPKNSWKILHKRIEVSVQLWGSRLQSYCLHTLASLIRIPGQAMIRDLDN